MAGGVPAACVAAPGDGSAGARCSAAGACDAPPLEWGAVMRRLYDTDFVWYPAVLAVVLAVIAGLAVIQHRRNQP